MTKLKAAHSKTASNVLSGVLVEIEDVGVLITGQPKTGKSTLALHLVHRGHRLIADDAPLFERHRNKLIGSAPKVLQDMLCVPPLGVLNIRKLFGDQCIAKQCELDFVINLDKQSIPTTQSDLNPNITEYEYLGVTLPTLFLANTLPTNWSMLVETSIKNFKLKQHGFNSVTHFRERQQQFIKLEHHYGN